jgi:multidrug transporter EmrE-like cation transporter
MLDETIREEELLHHHQPEEGRMPVESGRLTVLILLLIGIGLSVTGELLLKHGMNRFREQFGVLDLSLATLVPTLVRVFTQPAVLLGFVFVFGASIFWLAVLSRVHLSFAYPLLAFGYVVTALLARLLFNEPISATRWTGIVVICLGVVLVART